MQNSFDRRPAQLGVGIIRQLRDELKEFQSPAGRNPCPVQRRDDVNSPTREVSFSVISWSEIVGVPSPGCGP